MATQITRFIVSKSTVISWDDDCKSCPCGMWINRVELSPDETCLVIYLECPNCGVVRDVTVEPLVYAPHIVSKMEI